MTAYAARAVRVREVECAIRDAWRGADLTGIVDVDEYSGEETIDLELDRLALVAAETIVDMEERAS